MTISIHAVLAEPALMEAFPLPPSADAEVEPTAVEALFVYRVPAPPEVASPREPASELLSPFLEDPARAEALNRVRHIVRSTHPFQFNKLISSQLEARVERLAAAIASKPKTALGRVSGAMSWIGNRISSAVSAVEADSSRTIRDSSLAGECGRADDSAIDVGEVMGGTAGKDYCDVDGSQAPWDVRCSRYCVVLAPKDALAVSIAPAWSAEDGPLNPREMPVVPLHTPLTASITVRNTGASAVTLSVRPSSLEPAGCGALSVAPHVLTLQPKQSAALRITVEMHSPLTVADALVALTDTHARREAGLDASVSIPIAIRARSGIHCCRLPLSHVPLSRVVVAGLHLQVPTPAVAAMEGALALGCKEPSLFRLVAPPDQVALAVARMDLGQPSMAIPGVYRVPSSELGPDPASWEGELWTMCGTVPSPHVCASALKEYLKLLPNRLLDFATPVVLHECSRSIEAVPGVFKVLPREYANLLLWLGLNLASIAEWHEENEMSAEALGVVFGPVLRSIPPVSLPSAGVVRTDDARAAVESSKALAEVKLCSVLLERLIERISADATSRKPLSFDSPLSWFALE
jgi:hypothetical protein